MKQPRFWKPRKIVGGLLGALTLLAVLPTPADVSASTTTPSEDHEGQAADRKAATVVYTGSTSGMRGTSAELAAALFDEDGSPIAGRTVTFDVEGFESEQATDDNGVARVEMAILQSYGSQPMVVSFAGDEEFEPAEAAVSFAVLWEHGFADGGRVVRVNTITTDLQFAASGDVSEVKVDPDMTTEPLLTGDTMISIQFRDDELTVAGRFIPEQETFAALVVTGSAAYVLAGDGIVTDAACGVGRPMDSLCTVPEAWVARYDGPGSGTDIARAVGLSPDGSTVYVTGWSLDEDTANDYATVAYDADTGAERWVARYNGPTDHNDHAFALGVSPDGSSVFVTGWSYGDDAEWECIPGYGCFPTQQDYATVAYDARTGDERWVARYDGSRNRQDVANDLAVSPDSSTVYVTGRSQGPDTGHDYATVAYHAATGEERWVARYSGEGNVQDVANAIGVSPDGSAVFVTGYSQRGADNSTLDYATVAYDATTGSEVWVARYNGPGNERDIANALDVSPDGSAVYVTGRTQSGPGTSTSDYATVAYDAGTGEQRWSAIYDGPASNDDQAFAVEASPDGSQVFVTGQSQGPVLQAGVCCRSGLDYATVAYDTADGNQLWVARYDGPDNDRDLAHALRVSPDGSTVYVTGQSWTDASSYDAATVAYDAADGSEAWVARYDGPAGRNDVGFALVVSPVGSRVFVAGWSVGVGTGIDYATMAYDTEPR